MSALAGSGINLFVFCNVLSAAASNSCKDDNTEERVMALEDFTEVYERQVRDVHRFLLKLSGDMQAAEELTQQTFYKAFLHMSQFKGNSSLYTWLCTIGKNEWLAECRKRKNYPLEAAGDIQDRRGPEEEALRRERQSAVRQAVRGLPEPYREVVILRIYGELSFLEIASGFEKTESWAKVTFFRGKEKLRKELEGRV